MTRCQRCGHLAAFQLVRRVGRPGWVAAHWCGWTADEVPLEVEEPR